MNLPNIVKLFVLHFGEMGSIWGINRTVGQIYALIYSSEQPMNADQIVNGLGISRSNVAMGIKELLTMKLIMLKHLPNDRKDYYYTYQDIWSIARCLIEERRKRELAPTLEALKDISKLKANSDEEQYAKVRIEQMQNSIDMLTNWYKEMQAVETDKLIKILKMGTKIYNLYPFKKKLKETPN